MRHLGIDFGSKRVGLAMSDEQGKFAMPHSVLKNEKGLVDNILKIITSEKIEKIVLGESLNEKNQPNEIMEKINQFKSTLEKKFLYQSYLKENIFLASMQNFSKVNMICSMQGRPL